jgi:hypothetical protein
VQNPQTGEVWESADLLRIGRNPESDILLFDRVVSRYHALLWSHQGRWWIRDLDSRNGTRLNNESLTLPRAIYGGEEVSLGSGRLLVLGILVENAEQWDQADYAPSLLETMRHLNWASVALDRKLRLWAIACLQRRLWPEIVASEADLSPSKHDLAASAPTLGPGAAPSFLFAATDHATDPPPAPVSPGEAWVQRQLEERLLRADTEGFRGYCEAIQPEQGGQGSTLSADLLRCALGNPWDPPELDPAWLAWENRLVIHLAAVIDREGSLESLPILADALEDAGCDNYRVLDHLRSVGPHCRACHAVDAILGRQPTLSVPPK